MKLPGRETADPNWPERSEARPPLDWGNGAGPASTSWSGSVSPAVTDEAADGAGEASVAAGIGGRSGGITSAWSAALPGIEHPAGSDPGSLCPVLVAHADGKLSLQGWLARTGGTASGWPSPPWPSASS